MHGDPTDPPQIDTPPLATVWRRLVDVRSIRFDARSEAGTGWDGVAIGTVDVDRPSADVCLFREAGAWQTPAGPAVAFTNVFRWTRLDRPTPTLRLEHLRFGPDRPVLLFDMRPAGDGSWREHEPHLCGDDRYAATLGLDGENVVLTWTIRGPRKRESIRYLYT